MSDTTRVNPQNERTRAMTEIAIFVAFAFVLEVISKIFPSMPQGGSVSVSMVPIIVLAYRRGLLAGIGAGLAFGLLNAILAGFYAVHWASIFLDYFIPAGVWGLSALFFLWLGRNKTTPFVVSVIVVGLLQFMSHYASGVLFYGEFAPEGTPVWLYSLTYNAWYMVPSIVLSAIIIVWIWKRLKPMLTEELLNRNLF